VDLERKAEGFWSWYERHLTLATATAAAMFVLQLVHLYWLTTDVVLFRITGRSFFDVTGVWQLLIVVVDYFEIPALVTTSFVYINDIRKGEVRRGLLYLALLNSQWIHLLWITDEFVVQQMFGVGLSVPVFLAWVAILIDYLELPVIVDTLRRLPELLRTPRPTPIEVDRRV
jgi:hypothetical protein